MLLPASSPFIIIISIFQGPAKIFSVEPFLNQPPLQGHFFLLCAESHVLPVAALLTRVWGGASPLPPGTSPPARKASAQTPIE